MLNYFFLICDCLMVITSYCSLCYFAYELEVPKFKMRLLILLMSYTHVFCYLVVTAYLGLSDLQACFLSYFYFHFKTLNSFL